MGQEHPFYGPSARLLADPRTRGAGTLAMGAYLLFWAGAVAIALRELHQRFPKDRTAPDSAVGIVRERYARGEIDREQYLMLLADLVGAP